MDSTLNHGIIFGTFGFRKDSWIVGLDWGFSAFYKDGWWLILIIGSQDWKVHITDLKYGFLKNVLINSELIIILFRQNSTIPVTLFRVTLPTLNRYHEILVFPKVRNGNSFIRDVFYRYGVSQWYVILAGFDEGRRRKVTFGKFNG